MSVNRLHLVLAITCLLFRRGAGFLAVRPKRRVPASDGLLYDKSDPSDSMDDMRSILQTQQQQIDLLMSKLQEQVPENDGSGLNGEAAAVTPLKSMLFVDGTWLYYSFHGRASDDCPIIQKYGGGWEKRYDVDWKRLPGLITRVTQESMYSQRPLEMNRVTVYSSYRENTPRATRRYRMFEALKDANFDVYLMKTRGSGEKCIDIQLAVDMLHYATDGGGAYDVAFLLTGDRDFVPAIQRTRQKGKALGLVSMRRGCTAVLEHGDGLKDFPVLWLEDHLDELLVPKVASEIEEDDTVSSLTLHTVICDFIEQSPNKRVPSGDLGRYLKTQVIGERSLLSIVKTTHNGLGVFLTNTAPYYKIYNSQSGRAFTRYEVGLTENAKQLREIMADEPVLTDAERRFFDDYSLEQVRQWVSPSEEYKSQAPVDMSPVFDSSYTVAQLKDACREHGLPVSGVKKALIDRLNDYNASKLADRSDLSSQRRNTNRDRQETPRYNESPVKVDKAVERHLLSLVSEFLKAKGGICSSRDLGRYLAANRASTSGVYNALLELKSTYASVAGFISYRDDIFWKRRKSTDGKIDFDFDIGLKAGADLRELVRT